MTTSETLTRAKDALLKHGWCQGEERNARGELCIVGALKLSARNTVELCDAMGCFALALRVGGISDWNDDPERTPEDILSGFDRAIAFAQAEEALTAAVARVVIQL